MQFVAKARYVQFSPYKLRAYVDVVRGKNAQYALHWLATCAVRRVEPIQKMIASAVANAQHADSQIDAADLIVMDIRVDQGPMVKYFRPGAMGRANVQKRRMCHLSVMLESKQKQTSKEV